MRWIDKHGNQWLIDSELVPKAQDTETVHSDKQQHDESKQVKDAVHTTFKLLVSKIASLCPLQSSTEQRGHSNSAPAFIYAAPFESTECI